MTSKWAAVKLFGIIAAASGCGASSDLPQDPRVPVAAASQVQGEPDPSAGATAGPAAESDPSVNSAAAGATAVAPFAGETRTDCRALLVGCTTYENLSSETHLRGPVNDVRMVRRLLVNRFGVAPENVTMLIEGAGDDARPIRANIAREFERLAATATPGESIVIFLSGHGTQQPDDDPDDASDPEPDGLDEVFLPADIAPPDDPAALSIPNSIRDDELGDWISQIRARGAFVWAIVDACHSGSAIRGVRAYRQLSPERFFSRDVLQAAMMDASPELRAPLDTGNDDVPGRGEFVALYAAQPQEPTFELPMPPDDPDAQWSGLLTFTLCRILTESATPLTYRELAQRIHAEYVQALGQLGPTPLVEGTGQDRAILGGLAAGGPQHFVLQRDESGQWIITGGQLHGLTPGTICALLPPPGSANPESVIGHVRIARAQLAEAEVQPVAHADVPRVDSLPVGARCRPVYVAHGGFGLKVAIEADPVAEAVRNALVEALEQLHSENRVSIDIVHDPLQADWIVRFEPDGRLLLVPAAGWSQRPGDDSVAFSPDPAAGGETQWVCDSLVRIARAAGLLRVCKLHGEPRQRGWLDALHDAQACKVDVQLVRPSETGNDEPVEWTAMGLRLADGDVVGLRISNLSWFDVDVSVLFIDSRLGITALFPQPGLVADNRIPPDQTLTVGPMQVDATTVGLENLVVIASRGEGQPLDWSWLAQPALETTAQRSAAVNRSLQTPAGELLQLGLFRAGATRGLKVIAGNEMDLKIISWTTAPKDVE